MSYLREKWGLGLTFVFFPDLQGISTLYPAELTRVFTWLANTGARQGIQMVLSSGDEIQDNGDDTEWARVSAAYELLDAANLPYLVGIGNHDYDQNGLNDRRTTDFDALFPQSRFTSKSWWNGGFYGAGSRNAYCIAGGILYLQLEFGPTQGAVDWANEILTTNPGLPCVLSTHSYLYRDGTICSAGDQYNPHDYFSSDVHDGSELWTELVRLHDNIILVTCGHDILVDPVRRANNSDGGAVINQIMTTHDSDIAYYRAVRVNLESQKIRCHWTSGANTTGFAGDAYLFEVSY